MGIVYRVYVGSTEWKSGTATPFEYALLYTLAIKERSLAMIHVVVVPSSIKIGPSFLSLFVAQKNPVTTLTSGRCRFSLFWE